MAKTVIFANGQPSDLNKARKYIEPGDIIICADGGALHALALDVTPHVIVGDLDSLPESTKKKLINDGIEIITKPAKKDQIDLEIALACAVDRGAKEILILTALGGRLDHALANLLLLARPEWKSARISLAEGGQRARVLRGPDETRIAGKPGDTLSLVPLSPNLRGVDLEGLQWPAKNANFAFGSTQPLSNTLAGTEAIVRVRKGTGLVVHIPKGSK